MIIFEAELLVNVINQFYDWKREEKDIIILEVLQIFNPNDRSKVIVWYKRT